MRETLDRILKLNFGDLMVTLGDILRDPTSNLFAFVLLLTGFTVIVLVLIVVMLLIFGASDDEDETEILVSETQPEIAEDGFAEPVLAETESAAPQAPRHQIPRAIATALWIAAFAAIWVGGGWVSSSNTMCESCHGSDSIHKARLAATATVKDPHTPVACVSCHESSSRFRVVTTAVPGRAVHFVTGMVRGAWAADYGTPVADVECSSCHEEQIASTYTNVNRGVKVSHKEPIAAGARCVDCHVPHAETGIIDRYTVGMDPCLRCHDAKKASAECSYCHTKDIGLSTQSRGVIKPRSHVATLDCGGCHSQEKCDRCHGLRLPHTVEFMGPGHARPAVEDVWFNGGKTCKRCHTASRNSCTKCHSGQPPQHASPGFAIEHQSADPYNNGCNSCHGTLAWDAQRNFCGLCHPKYQFGLRFENGQ